MISSGLCFLAGIRLPSLIQTLIVDGPLRRGQLRGSLSEVNGPYNSTDVSDGNHVPTRRFLRAYHVRDYWIIWYEHGGIVTGQTTLALTPDNERRHGGRIYRVTPGTSLAGNLCTATKALIAGVRTGNP
jgi:hypothetical protein